MPPRTRGSKTTKTLKENLQVVVKPKARRNDKVTKAPRKALTDKTNSASGDDISIEVPKKVIIKNVTSKVPAIDTENKIRPRRERRLPTRYVESDLLNNLSNSKNDTDLDNQVKVVNSLKPTKKIKTTQPVKELSVVLSPLKAPYIEALESSLIVNVPKRLCRLPSKFDDYAISPTKGSAVQPCHASTPILHNKTSKTNQNSTPVKKTTSLNKQNENVPVITIDKTPQKRHIKSPVKKKISDTNNNANKKILKVIDKISLNTSATLSHKPLTKRSNRKVLEKDFSFKVLEAKQLSKKGEDDIYEFTYDPNEEPPPKKKRKRVAKKKPTQPKAFVFKNNYDRNLNKALAALKNVVAKKPTQPQVTSNVNAQTNIKQTVLVRDTNPKSNNHNNKSNQHDNNKIPPQSMIQNIDNNVNDIQSIKSTNETVINLIDRAKNYNSVRVEDIAADFEIDLDHNDMDYSPVNSPHRPNTPTQINSVRDSNVRPAMNIRDPLNLQEDHSFFDDIAVASNSTNMSVRQPQASPWRVEFRNLPIKWHVNTYVKPNMTPAVESSYIHFEDNKKKHVYTNMLAQTDEGLPEVQNNEPNLKQTSIMSFIKEVIEKSASKKKTGKSVTPKKGNTIFEDLTNIPGDAHVINDNKTPKKNTKKTSKDKFVTPDKEGVENVINKSNDSIHDKENCNDNLHENSSDIIAQKDKNHTYFGFDESEDQENVSPIKINNKVRGLRSRSRAVLQEINAQSGPTRALLPVAAKSKITSSDAVNQVYEEMKSAADAPVFPEKPAENRGGGTTNINDVSSNTDLCEDDSESVHLFEDLEIIHHLKPLRKSYGKTKKVTLQQKSLSDSDQQDSDAEHVGSTDEDDLADLTFTLTNVQPKKNLKNKKKKPTKKQKLAKEEEEAVEAWAAGFNSMCEDVDEFTLVVE
ncbi:dalmatian [Aphomia sociella]